MSQLHELPSHVIDFIESLTSMNPSPESVWLIGSQANGRATSLSDTDLLVFGSEALLNVLKAKNSAPEKIDCLVVYDGNNYQDPWQKKSGTLEKLKWKQVDENRARYVGSKWIPDEDSSKKFGADMGNLIYRNELGLRVWSCPKPPNY